MYIVIDTNAVNADLNLRNAGINRLASKAKEQGYHICFPKAVIEEMVKHYKENVEKALKDLLRADSIIQDHTSVPSIDKSLISKIQQSPKKYRSGLRTRIKELGGIILGQPLRDHHAAILKKAILRKKPFNSNGAGYPDAMIWADIMDLARKFSEHPAIVKPKIIFVSDNHKDFCNSDKFDLHDDLIEELESEEINKNTVIVAKSLDAASGMLLIHSDTIVLEEAKALLIEPEFVKSEIRKELEKQILNALPFRQLRNDLIGLSEIFEDPTIDMIHEDYTYGEIEAEILAEDEIAVSLKVNVTCLLDVYVEKSEAMHIDDLSIHDHDWNNHYVAAQVERPIWFDATFITNRKFHEILSFEIEEDRELNDLDDSDSYF